MNGIHKWIVFLLTFLLTANGVFYTAFADHDDHKGKSRYQKKERKHSEHNSNRNLTIVNNLTYTENCGVCHFAYQPGLLLSGSWAKILAKRSDHFEEAIELDPEAEKIIAEYLKANAADYSSKKLSSKIMKSVGNQTPHRITEISIFQEKHHGISPDVIKRKSIGSLSNCLACHTTAEKGIYSDDNVKIPQ
jgi:cell division protein FtsI/penicillin-binding protein 2